ncbi:MAG: bifunctional copper resistance protein CopD/cytochrome c oxidase assembly protein [Nocardiaceae bacterium]|nr:bifunctional copper resistance protein CopD/cytochrome c oxidase assembly protein [Nocardiaceae bacterium]
MASTATTPHDRSLIPVIYGGAVAVAALVAVMLAALSAEAVQQWLGIPDPGAVTTYGLPALTAIANGSGMVAVGALLLSAFLVPPQKDGILDVDGYRGLRTASIAATVWAVASYALVPLTLSNVSGHPVGEIVSAPNFVTLAVEVSASDAWLKTGVIALIIAGISRMVVRWGWAPLLFVGALTGFLPQAIAGHSSAGGAHDIATNSLMIHLFAAAVWVGGLFAVLMLAFHRSEHLPLALRRFSMLAGFAIAGMAVSGVLNALVRINVGQLLTTDYGRLVLVKIVILAVLGFVGLQQRQRAIPEVGSGSGPFIRYAMVEVALFALVLGVAVGLGRTPPPQATTRPTVMEVQLGYNLEGPPTFARLLFDWRFDLIYGSLAIVLAVAYVLGVRRLAKRGDTWPVGRTAAWLVGCAFLLIGSSSGIGKYAPAMFSVHMESHMILSMLVPIFLVLGAPVTLALRALPPAGRNNPPGPREWLLAAVHNPVSRFLTHPAIAAAIFVVGFYGFYLGGIFGAVVDSHFAHLLMTGHFLLSGYLFYWVAIGIDPHPRPTSPLAKLAMVFGVLPFHAFFAVIMMNEDTAMGGWYYKGLGLPWVDDLMADQKLGSSIAWAAAEVPLMVVMLALLIQWARTDQREARRIDRAADRDNDAELEAYNAMLRELAQKDRRP